MNKRLIGIITTMLALLLTTGCGNNTNNEVNTNNNSGKDNSSNTSSSNDVCPGCVYAYTTELKSYGGYNKKASVLTKDQYKTNYQDILNETGQKVFLGLKLDSKGTILKAYVCGIINGEQVCLEGSTDGSTYEKNKEIRDKYAYKDKVFVDIDTTGSVRMASVNHDTNIYARCNVNDNGYITCSERQATS